MSTSREDLDKILKAIEKTGFPLEYKVSKLLQQHGWNIINNRYYVDSNENKQRELDILAYKAKNQGSMRYYTTLLISCKKSEKKHWVFLTRDHIVNDPNGSELPIATWSNDVLLRYMLEHHNWRGEVESIAKDNSCLKNVLGLSSHVFASQEVEKSKGTAENDTAIHKSISELIQAVAYETKTLETRVRDTRFYNFNLLTVVDSTIVQVHFEDSPPSAKEVPSIKYVNRFIMDGKDNFYLLDFVTLDNFEQRLKDFDELFIWGVDFFSDLRERFYTGLFEDDERFRFQTKRAEQHLASTIWWRIPKQFGVTQKSISTMFLSIDTKNKTMSIGLGVSDEINVFLNSNEAVLRITREWLKKWFHYDGSFKFHIDDLPF